MTIKALNKVAWRWLSMGQMEKILGLQDLAFQLSHE